MRRIIFHLLLLLAYLPWPYQAMADDGLDDDDKTLVVCRSNREAVVRIAYSYKGTPYVYGGHTRQGVDCSGLVYAVFPEAVKKPVARTVDGLFGMGRAVDALLPADLVFFDTVGGVSHVGIHVGAGFFLHAASEGPETGVILSRLTEKYYATRFVGARRLLDDAPVELEITLRSRALSAELAAPLMAGEDLWLTFKDPPAAMKNLAIIFKSRTRGTEARTGLVDLAAQKRVSCAIPEPGDWTLQIAPQNAGVLFELDFSSIAAYELAPKR
jgi:probable lipoprotein NlpC